MIPSQHHEVAVVVKYKYNILYKHHATFSLVKKPIDICNVLWSCKLGSPKWEQVSINAIASLIDMFITMDKTASLLSSIASSYFFDFLSCLLNGKTNIHAYMVLKLRNYFILVWIFALYLGKWFFPFGRSTFGLFLCNLW